jgi:alkylation response protein AidB-like acyl-CoA dehydrogenase
MNLDETAEDRLFREEARTWLAENAPRERRPHETQAALAYDRALQRKLYDGGWAGVNWPKEYGGRGLSGFRYMIWLEECSRLATPLQDGANYTGLFHAGPTLIVRANEEQKQYHLPRILKGEATWCQGFSEPGAGTDLAALRTRGDIDGDHVVINGHKTWTSNGHYADFQELVVRTDPNSSRHHGLTWLICDMRSPGIEVRPIKTMGGESEVNDTFYNDVRIPISNVVGEIGEGWSVAMSTFAFERGIGFIRNQLEMAEQLEQLIQIAARTRLSNGRIAIQDDGIAQNLAFLKAEVMALRAMTISGLAYIERHGQPGPEGSMMKLLITTVYKKLHQAAADILGPQFLEYGGARASNPWTYRYLWSWVLTIAGGSNEIQRDVIADRILGLPRAR